MRILLNLLRLVGSIYLSTFVITIIIYVAFMTDYPAAVLCILLVLILVRRRLANGSNKN